MELTHLDAGRANRSELCESFVVIVSCRLGAEYSDILAKAGLAFPGSFLRHWEGRQVSKHQSQCREHPSLSDLQTQSAGKARV